MRIESVRDLHGQFPDLDGYWDSADLSVTEARIRAVMPADPAGEWSELALNALPQLSRVLNLQGRMLEAKEALTLAQKLLLASVKPLPQLEIRLLLEEGRHLCLNMTPVKAQPYFNRAWKLASENDEEFLAIEAAVMLSVSQPPKFQNEWLQRALQLAEKSKVAQAKLWLAQLYLMDGWRAFDFRRIEDALASFKLALARPRDAGEKTDLVRIRWSIARCLRALNRVQEAFEIQSELLVEVNRTGTQNGHVYLEVAECLQTLQRADEAKPYFESAYKELSANSWYADNKIDELARMQEIYKKRY